MNARSSTGTLYGDTLEPDVVVHDPVCGTNVFWVPGVSVTVLSIL